MCNTGMMWVKLFRPHVLVYLYAFEKEALENIETKGNFSDK